MPTLKVNVTKQKVKVNNDEEMYVARLKSYSRISRDSVIKMTAANCGISEANVASAFYALSATIKKFVLEGHVVDMSPIGTFRASINCSAEKNREADEKRKDEADARNDAEQMIFATEKAIKDLGDKVDKKDKEKAEDQIKDLKKALEGDDIDEIKSKQEALQETAMSLASKVYEEAAKAREAEGADTTSDDSEDTDTKSKNDDVMDAEFEEQ